MNKRKPAEIYIGERINVDMLNSINSKRSRAIYFKPDNGPKYIQIDIIGKKDKKITVRFIHEPTGLPDVYEKCPTEMITPDLLRIFDLLDNRYK